jgi:lipopolysaccharide transport system permease protein
LQDNKPHKIIKPGAVTLREYLKSVWANKHLIKVFALRDLKVKYAQTFLGFGWSILQPLTGLIIYYFFFGYVMHMNTGTLPYPVFVLSGLTAWLFFNYVVFQGGNVLIEKQDLIHKLSFPRILLPISKVIVGLAELLIGLGLLVLLMLYFGIYPKASVLLFPLVILIHVIVALSAALWLSVLTIKRRDFYHIIPYLLNLLLWFTPVFYPIAILPEKVRFLVYLNPMSGVVELYRYTLTGGYMPPAQYFIGIGISLILFVTGVLYYKKAEAEMPDYL